MLSVARAGPVSGQHFAGVLRIRSQQDLHFVVKVGHCSKSLRAFSSAPQPPQDRDHRFSRTLTTHEKLAYSWRDKKTGKPLKGSLVDGFLDEQIEILGRRAKNLRERLGVLEPNTRDWTELWGKKPFWMVSGGWNAGAWALILIGGWSPFHAVLPAGFTYLGLMDMNSHRTMRKNFPALIWFRYFFESVRPEIRQYIVEGDDEENPFSRKQRTLIYQRAKGRGESNPFGTRADLYDAGGYDWVNHSNLGAQHLDPEKVGRTVIGGTMDPVTGKLERFPGDDKITPYLASRLNISGMSYGALSDRAVQALNSGAKQGGFYHNTGEGSVSDHHRSAGADVVWNIGTGYFGCRDMKTGRFSEKNFTDTLKKTPGIRMIELKLSQGAKPGHGGIMPAAKLTAEIAEIRGVPQGEDCISPPWHAEFVGPLGLVQFLMRLRELSGKPTGFKMCVGNRVEAAAIIKALQQEFEKGNRPCDFITIDGAEGGTGAAPVEFSDRVGLPLRDGLLLVDDLLRGAGIRHEVKIIASGKIMDAFTMVRAMALGADVCNSARGFMIALGCIQALKCNTNHCPTGITTTNPDLVSGIKVPNKAARVAGFHHNTMHAFAELVGATGVDDPDELKRQHIMRRMRNLEVMSYAQIAPEVERGCLVKKDAKAPETLQRFWDNAVLYGGLNPNSGDGKMYRLSSASLNAMRADGRKTFRMTP
ncbi:unnamed protein product [Amoebophrya sp. A25]|nr:unnamed protein product [Amoebophrya sp. A25]|eukprot:GSA25T00008453001.1